MYRDFSDRNKWNLIGLVTQVENEKICNFTDWVGDRWYDFETWIGKLNIRNYLNNVNAYHKKVIDKNNTTKSTIETIFSKVKQVDHKYYLILSDKYTQLKLWKEYVEELSEIVTPSNGKFTADYISSSMGKKFEEYMEYINLSARPSGSFEAEIVGFDFTELVLDSRNPSKDALAIGWTRDWVKNLTSLFTRGFGFGENANETIMRTSIETVIKELLENKHEVSDFLEDYTDNLMPEEVEMSKKIVDHFLKTGEIYTEIEMAELMKVSVHEFRRSHYYDMLKQIDNKAFLKKISNKLNKTIGAYSNAVEAYDMTTQVLTKLFTDYTEELKYLKAIKTALIDGGYDNKTVNDIVDSMIWGYTNQFNDTVKYIADEGADLAINKGLDKVLPLLDVFISAKDISSELIGLKVTTDNVANIYATQQYSYALVDKYNWYRTKINSGVYTQEDIQQCQLYFRMAKAAKLEEYKSIKVTLEDAVNSGGAIFSSSEDKQYTRDILSELDGEIERLERLTL